MVRHFTKLLRWGAMTLTQQLINARNLPKLILPHPLEVKFIMMKYYGCRPSAPKFENSHTAGKAHSTVTGNQHHASIVPLRLKSKFVNADFCAVMKLLLRIIKTAVVKNEKMQIENH